MRIETRGSPSTRQQPNPNAIVPCSPLTIPLSSAFSTPPSAQAACLLRPSAFPESSLPTNQLDDANHLPATPPPFLTKRREKLSRKAKDKARSRILKIALDEKKSKLLLYFFLQSRRSHTFALTRLG